MEREDTELELTRKLANLYVTYRQRYVLCLQGGHIVTPKRKNGETCKQTDGVLRNHLRCKYAVCVFAGEWGSRFVCFDVDDGSRDTVMAIVDELSGIGIPRERIYVSSSGGKGYHVEVFFDEIVSTDTLSKLYRHVINKRGLDSSKVEFRPTNKAAIKLPLSIHAKTGNVCWYIDYDSFLPIERRDYLLEIQPIPTDILKAVIKRFSSEKDDSQDVSDDEKQRTQTKRACESHGENRNIGTLIQAPRTRHNIMRNITVYIRTHGKNEDECREELQRWLTAQDQSLIGSTPEEIAKDVDELIKWAYSEQFVAKYSKDLNHASICTTQMKEILKQKSRSCRCLLFLLLLRGKMLQPHISTKDAAKVIGVSQTTVKKSLRKMISNSVISYTPEEHFYLPDGSFSSTSRSYTVPHPAGNQNEPSITITMKELMFDFRNIYCRAMHALIPQQTLKEILSVEEWNDYKA